jgi:hypothetical protein
VAGAGDCAPICTDGAVPNAHQAAVARVSVFRLLCVITIFQFPDAVFFTTENTEDAEVHL